MLQHEPLGIEKEPYEYSTPNLIEALRSEGTAGEKIVRVAALSFAQGIEAGRSARMADDTGKDAQPA